MRFIVDKVLAVPFRSFWFKLRYTAVL